MTSQNATELDLPGSGWTNKQIAPLMYPMSQDGQIHLYKCNRRYIQTSQGWSRTGSSDPNDPFSTSSSSDKICHADEAKAVKSLMSQLCEKFYTKGWFPGTGGGMSVRIGSGTESDPFTVFSTPSGIQKEDMVGEDIFELDMKQNVVLPPTTPGLKLSSMTNLWYVVYNHRPSAMCVIHTHSMNAQLATLLDSTEEDQVLRLTHLEMLKGVGNHSYECMLEIPIIDNQKAENLLEPDMVRAIQEYPKCNAVLVRRHGVYVWGDSWEEAKTRLESFDYLFETAIKMKQMGIDFSVPPLKTTESRKRSFDRICF
jgi:methylthioribulose 1-phosphate dehydratase/enolase-phosphatase E1